jgi:dephospho-CoA kinase
VGRWANKYVIGLTGNIAMGKSLVRKMLEHLGAYTIDADGLAHQVMAPGAPAYAPVIETFGRWILDAENRVDRTKLGAVVFSHPEALARLEALTHPIVGQGIDTLVSRAKQPIVVIEAIKLIEGVLGQQVDAIWVVDAAPQIQLERLMGKRGMSEYEARKRIDTQNPQREKLAKANVVITNNGSAQDVWVQVEREWNKILAARGVQQRGDEVRTVQVGQQPATPQPAAPGTPPKVATDTVPAVQQQAPAPAQPAAPVQRPPAPQPAAPATPPKVATGTVLAEPSQPTAQPTAQPAAQATPPAPAPAQAAPPMPMQISKVDIRRGMPKNADEIARLINAALGKNLSRMDIMMAFGEKSYLLAEVDSRAVGLAGFQVENLITRMDEFIVVPEAPVAPVAEALIQAMEESSKELQSEVGFMFLPKDALALVQAFIEQGYERTELDAIKVPAWREAASESQPPNTQILTKKLRAERVLKPL